MLLRDPSSLDLAAVHEQFFAQGYARLGVWADAATLTGLRTTLDDIMAGKPPRPPKDWTPRTPSSGGDGSSGGTPAVAKDPSPTAA